MSTGHVLDIAEVKSYSGLPASTLRFYEEKGLITSIGRHGLRRLYERRVLEQLDFIALGRKAGFTLSEIADMFNNSGEYQIDRSQLLLKADAIEQRIKQLQAIRDGLRHAANCNAVSHSECPKFQRLLRLANKTTNKSNSSLKC